MSASSLVVDVAVAVIVAVACARGGRIANASWTRHLATSPSRRLAVAAATHAPSLTFLYLYFVRRNAAFCFIHFFLYDVLVLLYLYNSRCTSLGRANLCISVALFT